MSSWRNHRVIIASLFLPTTAVLGESNPPSPHNLTPIPTPVPGNFKLPESVTGTPPPAPRAPLLRGSGPLRSIVEDLKDKSRAVSPAGTPGSETINPFARFAELATPAPSKPSTPLPTQQSFSASPTTTEPSSQSPRPRRTLTDHHIPHRIQRKASRSSSTRRPYVGTTSPGGESDVETVGGRGWHVEFNPHCNGGLRNAVNSVQDRFNKRQVWVGVLSSNTDSWSDPLKRNVERKMKDSYGSVVVWIPDGEFSGCYDGFCHQVLWPALHYAVPDAPKTKFFFETTSYKQYVAVNQRFADAIVKNYQEGDIIWVNDYHLMLLPALIRAHLPHAPIGFFHHVAFPSSELFRCLSVREPLLRGVLGADLIGFQTANYARHFRQTVSRILSLEALPKGIQVDDHGNGPSSVTNPGEGGGDGKAGRFVDVGVFPMGIDVGLLGEKRRDPEVGEWVKSLKQRYAGMKMIVGRDKLDEVQGVRHKIQAFEVFLEKHPEYLGKIVLIQVALQTTETNELQGGVADVVARINSRFSTLTYQPVVFLHTDDLSFSQYLALLTCADAFLVTSLREGMALRTHEFVECQEERHRPLILSEFTGSYSYSGFRSCIAINPWDARSTADAMYKALTMSDEEADARWEDLHNHVVTQTAQAFVTSFLTRALRCNLEHQQSDSKEVAPLDLSRILPRYRHSSKRLLLIDFEGTLWKRDPTTRVWNPPQDVFDLLNKLAGDGRNEVWLLSGLAVKGAMEEVASKCPKIGIVAENGCFIKPRPGRTGSAPWINMVSNFNLTWKSACIEILNYFTERTPGSFVEEREASIVWRFWSGPVDESSGNRAWARRQAAEAQNHIFDSLGERYGLRIIPGANSFLILPNNISRSTAVGSILHPGGPAHSGVAARASWMSPDAIEPNDVTDIDFVLAVSGDEKLLRRLNELDHSETCSTSLKGTDAKWKLDSEFAMQTLWQIARVP
ncbi:glycosyltransferase family 20 protein [Jaapia argillacea MUCL 33604]|uniref:Glycosyltransferase family 20 protein n=1 Tax=Jaapia argillacea MUCL 33604 TaxID=933084 RepID=A0A067PJG5_9AGAM|nr:glycosyltransferase family 20 protein [Jaapia argillacea MUCL 33604]